MATLPDNAQSDVDAPFDLAHRVRWIMVDGKEVLLMDFSHMPVEHSLRAIDAFRAALKDKGPNSVYLLTDVTGAQYDSSIASKWKAARSNEDAKIRSSAVYGLNGLVAVAIYGFIEAAKVLGLSSGSRIRICRSAEEAKAWLAKQP